MLSLCTWWFYHRYLISLMRDLIIQMNILQSLLSLFYESIRSLAFIVKELCGLNEFIQLEIGYHPHSLGMVIGQFDPDTTPYINASITIAEI